ncbi:hypothetical protein ACT29H_10200 [Thermophagus sp. OGC60D27]|uniref:hypothetical protein n=1 Tax=Thermophagus sp. OGC60D27 TaxID=3458415 RepID=UPI0040381940
MLILKLVSVLFEDNSSMLVEIIKFELDRKLFPAHNMGSRHETPNRGTKTPLLPILEAVPAFLSRRWRKTAPHWQPGAWRWPSIPPPGAYFFFPGG